MIKALRVDERLIHGQVAVTWCSQLNITNIVVANDETSTDEVSVISLKMAAPNGVKVAVKTVKDAIALLKDPRCERLNILVLCKNPFDALEIVKAVNEVPYVNVGNFGMLSDKESREMLSTSFYINEAERVAFKEIAELKPESNYQMTPTLTPQSLSKLVK